MANLIYAEILKIKRSKLVFLSILGTLATPFMLFIEALQTHFEHPDMVFTLWNIYDNGLLYVMLLMNMMVYITIAAYIFSREYKERTYKTILTIPVSREKLLIGKFIVLLIWTVLLAVSTWLGTLIFSGIYGLIFGLGGFTFKVVMEWFFTYQAGSLLMFFTVTPFVYVAVKTKGIVVPMIGSAVIVMGSAALCNQKVGALYPWTATFFLMKGRIPSTGYPLWLSIALICVVSLVGFILTFYRFKKEDIK